MALWFLLPAFLCCNASSPGNTCIPTTDRKDTLRIVAFGNSTTATRKTISSVYAQRLPDVLSRKGIPCIVFNEGIPGSHTGSVKDNNRHRGPHALDRFKESVLSRKPDIVIICFGLNDSWIDHGKKESRIPPNEYRENLLQMTTKLQQRNIITILMTPNAIGSKYETWRYKNSSRYADIVRSLADEKDIPLVDQWKMFEEYDSQEGQEIDDLLLDGMHPNDRWHQKLSVLLANTILNQLNNFNHE